MADINHTSVKAFKREVSNPVLKVLVALLVIVLFIVFIPIFIYLIVVSIPFHFVIKACGGRGFTKWDGNHVSYNVPWWFALPALVALALIIFL